MDRPDPENKEDLLVLLYRMNKQDRVFYVWDRTDTLRETGLLAPA